MGNPGLAHRVRHPLRRRWCGCLRRSGGGGARGTATPSCPARRPRRPRSRRGGRAARAPRRRRRGCTGSADAARGFPSLVAGRSIARPAWPVSSSGRGQEAVVAAAARGVQAAARPGSLERASPSLAGRAFGPGPPPPRAAARRRHLRRRLPAAGLLYLTGARVPTRIALTDRLAADHRPRAACEPHWAHRPYLFRRVVVNGKAAAQVYEPVQ